ncbi:MAG: NACHT domain-containing protein [Hyphomicrobium sp.]|nr:NACHT domain-containing protein [Hyphomicrobium sp.]
MTGVETVLAGATINQTKGFVEALLGPHIEKVRRWKLDRELQKNLQPEKLTMIFERHVRDTLTSCATIHSIVFPQHELSLEAIYEPLALEPLTMRGPKSSMVLPQEIIRGIRHATIIDQAGMGKTTFAKYFTTRICRDTDKIPVFVNLRSYEGAESIESLLQRPLRELQREAGSNAFESLLTSGKFFVVFDGFDEVNPSWQSDVRRKLEEFAVQCGGSRILLTTRPQPNMPVLLGGHSYRIRRLTLQQTTSLLARYDKISGLEVGQNLTKELSVVPPELLETPLLVALLYRTYGANNTISRRLTAFYSDTYEALYRGHDLTKAGYIRKKESTLSIDEFRRFLQHFSFTAVVKSKVSWIGADELRSAIAFSSDGEKAGALECDLLTAVPLLVKDGAETRFIHRTFGEYFAAEFIARHADSQQLLGKLKDRFHWSEIYVVLRFINDLAPDLVRRVFSVPIALELKKSVTEGSSAVSDTLSEGFEWFLLWGTAGEIGDADAKFQLAGVDGAVLKNMKIVRREIEYGWAMCCRESSKIGSLPPFVWKELTSPVSAEPPSAYERFGQDGETEARLAEFLQMLLSKPRGEVVKLEGNDLKISLSNPYSRVACLQMVERMMDYEVEGEVRVLDRKKLDDLLVAHQRSLDEVAKLDDLLSPPAQRKLSH